MRLRGVRFQWHWLLSAIALFGAWSAGLPGAAPAKAGEDIQPLGAGFRFSSYGPEYDPGPDYWADVGRQMAARFPDSVPETVWIVGRLGGEGTQFNFPGDSTHPLIRFSDRDDNEPALTLFDQMGARVWLQVEPGNAPVEELIHIMLERYGHHPCVVGVGVDVEWYRSTDKPEGQAVTDGQARSWLQAARSHDPEYRLFLKHWLIEKMPPTVRDGLYFIDDSQILPSLDAMVAEFAEWGRAFAPAPVGFQYGYPSDRPWWGELDDPPGDIGTAILAAVPNARGLFWVDFTVLQVFPPHSERRTRLLSSPVLGAKIYEHEGDFDRLFEEWRDLGFNSAFVGERLASDPAFRAAAEERRIALYLIAPVFFDPQALAEEPDLWAITADGRRAEDDWVQFVCPSRQAYRQRRVREISELAERIRPQGLSLDFIRHFVFWEMVRPGTTAETLPRTCFCSHCVARFVSEKNLAIPPGLTETRDRAHWILTEHEREWHVWRARLITSMVREITRAVREVDPEILINLHVVPWRRDDFDGAIDRVAGQDLASLSTLVEVLSPMCYSFMLHRPPGWIHSVVEDHEYRAHARILPSIQVREAYREGDELSDHEFESSLREALKAPSSGVVLWSWEALAQEPGKQEIVRRVLREAAREESGEAGLRFEDVAQIAGLDFRYTFGDYAYDNILESSGSGATWIDHDGDGDLDLYLLNGVYLEGVSDPKGQRPFGRASNRFYCNRGDGTFFDCTTRTGLADSVWSMAAAAGDLDDDGFTDLFVANYGPNRLFRNNRDGTFTDIAPQLDLVGPAELNGFVKWSVGGSWLDFDRDGDLDLAVCNFLAFDPYHLHPGREWEMPDPKEYRGQASLLYRQREDGRFVDVTREVDLLRPDSKCMGITVLDFDHDGRLDIFQGNDHQPNYLFRARRDGSFEEVGSRAGVSVNDEGIGTGSMHASPGDVDGDGRIDLLVVDLRHGSLYRQVEPLLFEDSTWSSGVGQLLDGLGQWGAGLVDFDHDGDLDLFTANGVAPILEEQYPVLAVNDGSGRFHDARAEAGAYFNTKRSGRGAAFGDYDNDGDVDIVVNHVDHQADVALLRNDSRRLGNWIGFRLEGRGPRTAHGAHLEVETEAARLVRVHQPVAGYLAGNDPRIHLGLRAIESVVRVTVTWPSGCRQAWRDLASDHYWTLREGCD